MMHQLRRLVSKPNAVTSTASPLRMLCINHTKVNPKPLRAGKNGIALLHDPLWSKGMRTNSYQCCFSEHLLNSNCNLQSLDGALFNTFSGVRCRCTFFNIIVI